MGIQGLLPFLKKIHEPVNVSVFAGCTVAIDAYCWLHKGAFSCAEKLALGEKTDQYVYYCMKFINYLLSKDIKPVMVFDGCHLPSKGNVEKSRREKRELNRKKAAQFLREGKRAEARECLQRCIDISPEMALELMNACRERGVDCIVAPYEADAQLAYLNKIGVAQVVITEDSDLLLFGCEKVMFKMDHAGNGILIEKKRLNEVTDIQGGQYSFDKFRYMCILSGCDYLQSLSGIGLARANKVFKIARQADVAQLLKKLSTYLKSNISVPQEYIDGFIAANNTFLYQLVFDPLQRKLVPLTPYQPDADPKEMAYAGAHIPTKKALQISLGNINIYTGEQFASFDPDTFQPKYVKKKPHMLHMLSIWDKSYRVKPHIPLHETQLPERPSLKGKEVHVKVSLKKHSPHKRTREAEDSVDVKSNTELYDMYSSPVKKKQRTEDIGDNLQRFMFASKIDVPEEQEGSSSQKLDAEKLPKLGSPEFFNSLSKAHPGEQASGDIDLEEKENGVVSPRRNVFANKSPTKKPRFNLNAPKQKEVKSRFFTQPSSKPEAEDENSSENTLNGYRPVHSNTANIRNSASDISDNEEKKKMEETMKTNSDVAGDSRLEVTDDQRMSPVDSWDKKPFRLLKTREMDESPKSSPIGGSAFSWNKFKLSRHNSTDAVSRRLKNSKSVEKQFKKVVSENNLDSFLKKTQEISKNNYHDDDSSISMVTSLDGSSQRSVSEITSLDSGSQSQQMRPVSSSMESFPCSIDSDCLTDQDLKGSEPKSCLSLSQVSADSLQDETDSSNKLGSTSRRELGMCQSADEQASCSERPVFVLDSDEEDNRPSLSKKKAENTKTSSSKGLSKPSCRVSGLSKRSKKSNGPQQMLDSKQKSLKDMFSKFAHNKSEQPRLTHSSSQEDDEGEDFHTPETATSLLHRKNSTKRVLLP